MWSRRILSVVSIALLCPVIATAQDLPTYAEVARRLQDPDASHLEGQRLAEQYGKRLLPVLAQALRHESVRVRRGAILAVHTLDLRGEDAAKGASGLLSLAADDDESVRWDASNTLSDLIRRNPELVTTLAKALRSKDARTVVFAMGALSGAGERAVSVLPDLVAALSHADPRVRQLGAEKIGELKGNREIAVVPLTRLLRDEAKEVRIAAVDALGGIGAPAVSAVVKIARDEPTIEGETVVLALRAIGKPALPTLLRLLSDDDTRLRRIGIGAFVGDYWDHDELAQAAVPELIGALRDPDPIVKAQAARALRGVRDRDGPVRQGLERALEDPERAVSLQAALTLTGGWGAAAKRALEILATELKTARPHVAQEIALALGRGGGNDGLLLLGGLLEHGDHSVRGAALLNIFENRDKAPNVVVSLVVKALDDRHPEIRHTAHLCLREMGGAARAAVPGLIVRLSAEKSERVREIAITLGRIGSDARAAVPALEKIVISNAEPRVTYASASALNSIGIPAKTATAFLLDRARRGSSDAARHIARMGRAASHGLPELLAMYPKSTGDVRSGILEALSGVGAKGEKVLKIYSEALKSPDGNVRVAAVQGLATLGPAAAPAALQLIEAMADENWLVAQRTPNALAAIGEAAVPSLTRALKDSRAQVRELAQSALEQIKNK